MNTGKNIPTLYIVLNSCRTEQPENYGLCLSLIRAVLNNSFTKIWMKLYKQTQTASKQWHRRPTPSDNAWQTGCANLLKSRRYQHNKYIYNIYMYIYIYIEVCTQLPPFYKRHFGMRFIGEDLFFLLIQILPVSVPIRPIYNKSFLGQVRKAWRRTGNKPLAEAMMTQFVDIFMRHQTPKCL